MVWEHITTARLDERFEVVVRELAPYLEGKTVFDLNCGRGELTNYLPDNIEVYIGNDISSELLYLTPLHDRFPIILMRVSDIEVYRWLPKKIDILTLFGASVGTQPIESQYQDKVFEDIVNNFEPEILVIECCRAYKEKHKLLDVYRTRFNKYKLIYEGTIQAREVVNPDVDIRDIIILKK